MSCATARRMKNSPQPVAGHAAARIGIGAARRSSASRRRGPSACWSCRRSRSPRRCGRARRARLRRRCRNTCRAGSSASPSAAARSRRLFLAQLLQAVRRCRTSRSARVRCPSSVSAKRSAPAPISITCGESSITARASTIGLRTSVTPATAPARSVAPSMIEASSSCLPSASNTAPLPALKCGDSSSATTVACTASSALPPLRSTASPASRALLERLADAASRPRRTGPRVRSRRRRRAAPARWVWMSEVIAGSGRPMAARIRAPSRARLLLAQRLDRIQHARPCAPGSSRRTGRSRSRTPPPAPRPCAFSCDRQVAEPADQQRADDADRDADDAADQRDQHRLGEELPAHVATGPRRPPCAGRSRGCARSPTPA